MDTTHDDAVRPPRDRRATRYDAGPSCSMGGTNYPVTTFFLEDVLKQTKRVAASDDRHAVDATLESVARRGDGVTAPRHRETTPNAGTSRWRPT